MNPFKTISSLVILVLICSSIAYSQIKYNEEIKKSSMTTEEAMEYYLNELKKDPYVKEYFGWKLFLPSIPCISSLMRTVANRLLERESHPGELKQRKGISSGFGEI